METAKKTIGAIFGFTEDETNFFLVDIKQRTSDIVSIIARIVFVIAFIHCLIFYTTAGLVLLVLAYYLVELEKEVENLKRRIKDLE